MHTSFQIANWFIEKAKEENKKLYKTTVLKLAYIAHGYCLALYGKPLFEDKIEAWKFGPVILDLYFKFDKQNKNKFEADMIKNTSCVNDKESEIILKEVWKKYKGNSAKELSEKTHEKGTPWTNTVLLKGLYNVIPNELIKQYYQVKLGIVKV